MKGLVLEGGGAKGSFHIGALKALFERGYKFDGVMGTSIGAINGAMIAQGDFEKCYEMWQTITPSMVLDVDDDKIKKLVNSEYDRETIIYFLKFLKNAVANRGLSMDKAYGFLDKYIDEKRLRESPMDFGIVTVSTSDDWMPVELFKEEIPEGMLTEFIIASANFPAFKRAPIGGKKYMDGGIYDNLPINPLIRRGYDDIVAIRTMSNMPHSKVIDRSVKVLYISPSEPLGNTLSFTNETINKNLKLGYFDALRVIDGLSGKKYYLEGMTDGEFAAYLESNYGVPLFKAWSEILGVKGNKQQIIKALFGLIDKDADGYSGYRAFVLALEAFAAAYGLERFKVYKLKDFISQISIEYRKTGRVNFERSKDINATLQQIIYSLLDNSI